MSVATLGDDEVAGVEQLAVAVPLHLGRRGGVDGAGDLHLVSVPRVDEGLLLLDLRLVLHVQLNLRRKSIKIVFITFCPEIVFSVAAIARSSTSPVRRLLECQSNSV